MDRYPPYTPEKDIKSHQAIVKRKLSRFKSRESWGPRLWTYIHMTSLHHLLHPHDKMREWFVELENIIPCQRCTYGYRKFLNGNLNDNNFFHFTVQLHNYVNRKKGCSEMKYEQALILWKHNYANGRFW